MKGTSGLERQHGCKKVLRLIQQFQVVQIWSFLILCMIWFQVQLYKIQIACTICHGDVSVILTNNSEESISVIHGQSYFQSRVLIIQKERFKMPSGESKVVYNKKLSKHCQSNNSTYLALFPHQYLYLILDYQSIYILL